MMIKVTVTKEMYQKAMWCGTDRLPPSEDMSQGANCAIALALREICPTAAAGMYQIYWGWESGLLSDTPCYATIMIRVFDHYAEFPEKRLEMPEFSFEVDFPDALVEEIGIDEVKKILQTSETLQAV